MARDVIIVGGGIIGCSIALRLAQEGLKVTLIERGRIGCESSRAAAGMLAPQTEAAGPDAFLDLCLRSRSLYRDFAAELTGLSGIDVEYRDEGMIFVALDEQDERESERWSSWQAEAGLELERVGGDFMRSLEPAVTKLAAGGVFIPADHQVENRKLMDALAVALKNLGVEIIEGASVDALAVERERLAGVVCERQQMAAGAVVCAAGAWSGRLLERAGLDVMVAPVRGQMVAVRGAAPLISRVVHSRRCYLVPRRDGRIVIGATVEYAGFDKAVTAGGIQSLLAAAIEVVPSLAECEVVECWSGLRPDTIDHLPVMGSSGIDNLLLATGHFRNGILLAPVTASLIADLIFKRSAGIDAAPFSVERFARLVEA